jgi:hypothetical protein
VQGAIDWLAAALAAGPVPSTTVLFQATQNAIPRSALLRAKVSLGVLAVKEGDSRWWWKLPADPSPVPPKPADPPVSIFDNLSAISQMLRRAPK